MIRGFVLPAEGPVITIEGSGVVQDAVRNMPAVWLDLEAPPLEEMAAVDRVFELGPEAIEDCLVGEQRPRVDEYERHLFAILYAVIGSEDSPEFSPRKLSVFLGKNYLITVHQEPVRAITDMHRRVDRHADTYLKRGVDFVFFTIVDQIVDNCVLCAEHYEEVLEKLEADALEGDFDSEILGRMAELRRELLELRRTINAQREIITPFAHSAYDFVSGALESRFAHVADHLTQANELLDGLRELLNGLRDHYHAVIAERTSNLMRTLTLFSTFLMPMSLVAGIYGMNVAIWPSINTPLSFVLVLLGMAVIGMCMVVYFRRRKWI